MSTPQLTTYDFDQVSVIHGPVICDGFAEGSGVTIEHDAPTFNKYVGADGKVVRTKTLNRCAKITIKLSQASAANDQLSALWNLDVSAPNGAGVVPLMIRDRSGRGLWTAAQAWIAEPPTVDLGNEVTPREWVIECARLERLDGGN